MKTGQARNGHRNDMARSKGFCVVYRSWNAKAATLEDQGAVGKGGLFGRMYAQEFVSMSHSTCFNTHHVQDSRILSDRADM